jgi:hypothetical protein
MNGDRLWLRAVQIATLGANLLVVACGGGGGGEPANEVPRRSAEGLWLGTTNTGRALTGLILRDGQAWLFYSAPNESDRLAGVMRAPGSSLNGGFSSGGVRDLDVQEDNVRAATLSASYVAQSSLAGAIMYSFADTVSFSCSYSVAYDSLPAPIDGNYVGQAVALNGFVPVQFAIDSAGMISGSLRSCQFSGNATPRNRANVYDVSLLFSDAACEGFDALSGVAFFNSGRLFVGAFNGSRDGGFAFALSPSAAAGNP